MAPVTVRLVDDLDEVVSVAGRWLAQHRVEANVPATILAAEVDAAKIDDASAAAHTADEIDDGQNGATGEAFRRRRPDWSWAIAVDAAGDVHGLAVQTPPHPAVLASPDTDVAVLIADAWHRAGRLLPGVTGPVGAGSTFALRWTELTGRAHRIAMREGLHVLRTFSPATAVRGRARTAGVTDLEWLARWLGDFEAEALGHLPPHADVEALRRRLAAGEFVLWEDAGAPVSLAAWRMAAGIGRIGPVYTPPEHRRHGYGAAVTSAATQAVLDLGGDPILYTDLANPTSNAVYARLGYRMVGEVGIWVFACAAGR
jgi:GNAT superfamily N-acetyltransferase